MKLRNKKTGEIGYLYANKDVNYQVLDEDDSVLAVYNTLPRLIEEWKDVPEDPKDIWWLDGEGHVYHTSYVDDYCFGKNKEIGNYFETKEEAEKAVEKLKAWKRLKGKGFRFNSCKIEMSEIIVPEITITAFIDTDEPGTLNLIGLLFGGEE